jgi:diguanylate cyclase (GGDEF)-like protein/PAS domain S-box-containing protein
MIDLMNNFKDEWVLNALMENTGDSIYIKDRECRLCRISRKMASDLGYNDPADIYGQTDVELFGPELGNRTVLDDIRVMENRQPIIGLMESYIDKHGATNWTSTTKLPIFNDHGEVIGLLGITREINELKNSEIGFQWMATHDTLTSLANRFLLSDRIEQAIFHARRNTWLFALLFIDLNGFKKINDVAGHAKGDQYLKNVAQVLTKSVRQSDTVARIGGDEFVVLLEGLKNVEEASLLADKLTELIRMQVDPQEHRVTAAIGVSTYPADGVEPEILLKTADRAMYAAKKNLGRS